MSLRFKVYEFKAELPAIAVETVNRWLIALEAIWNEANKVKDTQRLIRKIRHQHGGKVAPSAVWEDGSKKLLSAIRAKKYFPPDSVQQQIPTAYRDGLIDSLKKSWTAYYEGFKSGNVRGLPKFKGKKNRIRSLITLSGKSGVKVSPCKEGSNNAWCKMPGLEPFKIKGFYKRFPAGLKYTKVALVKDAHQFYIQFTAEFEPAEVERSPARQIGVDPGIKLVAATSDGACIKPRQQNPRIEQRLKRLQRKSSRQQLRSNGWQKTQAAIARLHCKIRRNRKAFNAKVADGLGRFDVAFEGSRLQNMSRRAKPKEREDGKGYEKNGATAKSALNRALLNNGLGQLRQLTEARCKSRQREFVKTKGEDVRYSSRRCHCCSEIGTRPTQEIFACQNEACQLFGEPQHADVNAAKNHRIAGFNLPREATPVHSGKVKRVKSGATQAAQAERSAKPSGEARDSLPEPHRSGEDLGGEKPHKAAKSSSTRVVARGCRTAWNFT